MKDSSQVQIKAEKELKYKRKEELEKLRQKLIIKIIRDIANKYFSLFQERNATIEMFTKDISQEVNSNLDFNTDYPKFFQKIEKLILSKLNKIPVSNRESMPTKNEIHEIISADKSDLSIKITKPKEILKKKQNDEWAKITDFEYKNYLNEKKAKEQQVRNIKSAYHSSLSEQIKLKKEMENILKAEENRQNDEILKFSKDLSKQIEEEKMKKNSTQKKIYRQIINENNLNRQLANEKLNEIKLEELKIEEKMKQDLLKQNLKNENIQKEKLVAEKELKSYLKKQIDEKKKIEKEKQKIIEKEKSEIAKINKEIIENKEKLEKTNSQLKSTYKEQLINQINSKNEAPLMSDLEKSINKKILEKI